MTTLFYAPANTAVNYYSFAVNSIWYEDECFYILYEAQTEYVAGPAYTVSGLYLQGYFQNGSFLYTTSGASNPTTISSSIYIASWALSTPATGAKGQNSNYTNSASIYVIYNDLTDSSGSGFTTVKGAIITRYTGAVSTPAFAIATGTAAVLVNAGGIITYNDCAGIYGWIIGNLHCIHS